MDPVNQYLVIIGIRRNQSAISFDDIVIWVICIGDYLQAQMIVCIYSQLSYSVKAQFFTAATKTTKIVYRVAKPRIFSQANVASALKLVLRG